MDLIVLQRQSLWRKIRTSVRHSHLPSQHDRDARQPVRSGGSPPPGKPSTPPPPPGPVRECRSRGCLAPCECARLPAPVCSIQGTSRPDGTARSPAVESVPRKAPVDAAAGSCDSGVEHGRRGADFVECCPTRQPPAPGFARTPVVPTRNGDSAPHLPHICPGKVSTSPKEGCVASPNAGRACHR